MDKAGISARIKKVRQIKALNKKELMQKLNISRTLITALEQGKAYPSGGFLILMFKHFAVNINWLLTGRGDIFISNPVNFDAVNPVTIGERLKRIRFEKGLTQREMAARLKTTSAFISAIELNKFAMGFDIIYNLHEKLGVNIGFLLTGVDPEPPGADGGRDARSGLDSNAATDAGNETRANDIESLIVKFCELIKDRNFKNLFANWDKLSDKLKKSISDIAVRSINIYDDIDLYSILDRIEKLEQKLKKLSRSRRD
jgi:transcriptional regulator with XRE-family HTH domain